MTGRDLAAERVRRSLRQADIAARMGVSRARVTSIESLLRPPRRAVERYLAALKAAE